MLTLQPHVPTNELLMIVLQQYTWQQAAFTENLEAIADAQHLTSAPGEVDHLLHHRGETRQRTAAQVISVREATRQYDAIVHIKSAQVTVFVPEHYNFLS